MFSLFAARTSASASVASCSGAAPLVGFERCSPHAPLLRPHSDVIACDYKRDPSGYGPSSFSCNEGRVGHWANRPARSETSFQQAEMQDPGELPPRTGLGIHVSEQQLQNFYQRTAKRQPCPLEPAIKETNTLAELEAMYSAHADEVQLPETVLMCHHLSRLCDPAKTSASGARAVQEFLGKLLVHIQPDMMNLNTYECVVLLLSVAKLRYVPSLEWLGQYFEVSLPTLALCGPGNLTVLIRSLARLELQPWDLKSASYFKDWMSLYLTVSSRKMKMFRGDQLVHVINSLADLQYRPDREWTMLFSNVVHSKLENLDPGALTKGMLALAKLQCKPSTSFVRAYNSQLHSQLPMLDDKDMATTVQAMSLLRRLIEEEFVMEFYEETLRKLDIFTPRSLSNLLVALGSMVGSSSAQPHSGANRAFTRQLYRERMLGSSYDASATAPPVPALQPPSAEWTSATGDFMLSRMGACNVNDLGDALWGLATLGYLPDSSLLDDAIRCSAGKLHHLKTEQMVRLISALGLLGYVPSTSKAQDMFVSWCQTLSKLAGRRTYNPREVCDLIHGLGELSFRPACLSDPDFINSILKYTQVYNLKNTSPSRLASLAKGLYKICHQPSYGFLHNYCQASRFMWQGFKPQDYSDMLESVSSFHCPVTAVEPLWSSEFMAQVLCRVDTFHGSALSSLLRALTQVPGLHPSAQWLAAVIYRVEELLPEFTGRELGDIVVALGSLGYRPPTHVLDACVYCIGARLHEIPLEKRLPLAQALDILIPNSSMDEGQEGHYELQNRLRSHEGQLLPECERTDSCCNAAEASSSEEDMRAALAGDHASRTNGDPSSVQVQVEASVGAASSSSSSHSSSCRGEDSSSSASTSNGDSDSNRNSSLRSGLAHINSNEGSHSLGGRHAELLRDGVGSSCGTSAPGPAEQSSDGVNSMRGLGVQSQATSTATTSAPASACASNGNTHSNSRTAAGEEVVGNVEVLSSNNKDRSSSSSSSSSSSCDSGTGSGNQSRGLSEPDPDGNLASVPTVVLHAHTSPDAGSTREMRMAGQSRAVETRVH